MVKSVGLNPNLWVYLFLIGPLLLTVRKFDAFHKDVIRDRKLNQFKEVVEEIKNEEEFEKQLYTEILAQERFRVTCNISATKLERKELSVLLSKGVVTIKQLRNCWQYMRYDGCIFSTKVHWFDKIHMWYSVLAFVLLIILASAYLILILGTEGLSNNLQLFILPICLYVLSFFVLVSGATAFSVPYLQEALNKYYKKTEPNKSSKIEKTT